MNPIWSRTRGLVAAVSAMIWDDALLRRVGEDAHHLSLVALAAGLVLVFPAGSHVYAFHGVIVLLVSVLLYLSSAYIAKSLGGSHHGDHNR